MIFTTGEDKFNISDSGRSAGTYFGAPCTRYLPRGAELIATLQHNDISNGDIIRELHRNKRCNNLLRNVNTIYYRFTGCPRCCVFVEPRA